MIAERVLLVFESLQGRIFKRFALLAGGSVAAQAQMFLILPIITQVYVPADFGLLGAFTSIVMLVLPAAALRFDLAIPIPTDDDDARMLAILAFVSLSVVSFLVWLALYSLAGFLGVQFVSLFDLHGWLIPLTVWTAGLFSLTQYWAIRRQHFKELAWSHGSRGFMGASTQVALGLAGVGSLGLLIGQAMYMGLGAVYLSVSFLRAELHNLRNFSVTTLRITAKKYWRFPIFSTPEALLDAAGMHLPLLIVASLLGAEAAGLLFLAQRLTAVPVALISGNLSRVYIGEAPAQLASSNLHAFTMGLWRKLFLIGLGPALLIAISAPLFTEIIFGEEWSAASIIIAMLTPAAFMQFCVTPISTALHVLKKQAVAMILQAFGLVVQIGSFLLVYFLGTTEPLMGLAVGAALYYFVYTMTVFWAIKGK